MDKIIVNPKSDLKQRIITLLPPQSGDQAVFNHPSILSPFSLSGLEIRGLAVPPAASGVIHIKPLLGLENQTKLFNPCMMNGIPHPATAGFRNDSRFGGVHGNEAARFSRILMYEKYCKRAASFPHYLPKRPVIPSGARDPINMIINDFASLSSTI